MKNLEQKRTSITNKLMKKIEAINKEYHLEFKNLTEKMLEMRLIL